MSVRPSRTARVAGALALLALIVGCSSATPEVERGRGDASARASAAVSASAPVPKARAVPAGSAEAPRVALGAHGAVASQEANATDVGLAVLKRGGNAIDAAVAVGFALAVTHPSAGNVGGGGFMVVRMADGRTFALDYREAAPGAATRDMYLDKDGKPGRGSLDGPLAAGIPGTVAGLWAAHEKLGQLPWKDLVMPAVKLAEEGFALDPVTAEDLAKATKKMRELKFDATAAIFEKPGGGSLAAGDKLVQPELGKTLRAIADGGPTAFYEGQLADTFVREVKKAGGVWASADLKGYRAKWREPIVFPYRGRQIVSMPPPSSGGIVLEQLLLMSEKTKLEALPWRSADEVHVFAEEMRRAYADRNNLLGDPDFVKMPLAELVDPAYLDKRIATIDRAKATPSKDVTQGIPQRAGSDHTTHFSVIDEAGDAVANTYTLNWGYGCKYVVPGTGVLLNNEMDDFAVAPGKPNAFGLVQGEINKIEPGKRMLSSMAPTIVVENGEVRAILGSPGGPTITTTVAQLLRAVVDYRIPLDQAVPAFRAHHQWLPDEIAVEGPIPDAVIQELERRGHTVKKRDRIGHANVIEVDPETRGFRAVADTTRGGGKAAAY